MIRRPIRAFPLLLFVDLASAMGQGSSPANFVEQAGALQNKLDESRRVFTNLNISSLPVADAEKQLLDQDNSACLERINALDNDIKGIEKTSTLEGQARLVLDLQRLQGAVINLEDSLLVMRERAQRSSPSRPRPSPPGRWPPISLGIRSPLEGSWESLSYQLGQELNDLGQSVQTAKATTLQQTGQISGQIYRADTGQPLEGVKVMLGVLSSSGPPFRSVQTAADGSYRFLDVPPGSYRLGAYRAGFARAAYSGNLPHGGWATLSLGSAQKLKDIHLKIHPLASVTQMKGNALEDVLGTERFYAKFWPGYFSPDGKLFAFASGDPDPHQVWLYDINLRLLTRVTDKPPEGFGGVTMAWVGDTLYVEYTRGTGRDRFFAATPRRSQEIPELPPPAADILRENSTRQIGTVVNRRFVVSAVQPPCRGCDINLTMRTTHGNESYLIASGPGVENFVFESHRSLVFFPRFFYAAISVFDLNTRQTQETYLPNRAERLLDARLESGGLLVAYTSYGPCMGYDNQGDFYPIHPVRSPYNVCFAKIPFCIKK